MLSIAPAFLMRNSYRFALFLGFILTPLLASSQVVGSRSNSDLIPTTVEPAKLSGGGFSGDVNVFNGAYNASHPLGAVSTPGGLQFAVNLNYSASYSVGQSPKVASGIPYGEGWSVGLPTITASNAAYFAFLSSYECYKNNQVFADSSNYFFQSTNTMNGIQKSSAVVNGDVFWFSPRVSIPGVGSGRAVFKYIDEDDAKCAVFVLNKFERYVELRYYGDRWTVLDDAGNRYVFNTTLVTYHSPNNARVLNYNTYNIGAGNRVSDILNDNAYNGTEKAVLNEIEPKQAFTSWYCTVISNANLPGQRILLEYEKFGGFNYFKEFEQSLVEAKINEKLRHLTLASATDLDYTAYTDILLSKVTSFVDNAPYERLDMDYATSNLIGSRMLDPNDAGVERLDSLYAYTPVYTEGLGSDQFNNWNRYYHGKSQGAYDAHGSQPAIQNNNPYLVSSASAQGYIRDEVSATEAITFDHAFLESPRILDDGTSLVPGDIYEIRTKVTDHNGADAAMGTGTLDIQVVTGDLGFELGRAYYEDATSPCDSLVTIPSATATTYSSLNNTGADNFYSVSDYEKTRSTPVFTTQNQAVKWHLAQNAANVNTSNFFVMPNIPHAYKGVNLQIGPGNSDTEYANGDFTTQIKVNEDGVIHPSAYRGYSHTVSGAQLTSYKPVSNSFGIGVPWTMVEPLYINQMGGVDDDGAHYSDAYDFWWNEIPSSTYSWDNEPTKFNENVKLAEVELIRYSKVPYMLTSVKTYRVNGEISPLDDTSGIVLIAQHDLEYSYDSKYFVENYPYEISDPDAGSGLACYHHSADTLIHSTTYQQYVYTLDVVKNIPVRSWDNNPSVASSYADSSLLQTEFEYDWYGYEDGEALVYDQTGYPGRRTRVLTKYTDQLGGETHIEYYPRNSKFTLKEGRYAATQSCSSGGFPIFGKGQAYDVHPAVHYITKLDEKDNVSALLPGEPLKRWEYVYDTTQIIYQSFDYDLPANFRGGYTKSYSKGFAKTTVYDPELETGEQSSTEYYHHGNVYTPTIVGGTVIPDPSTITEYLYFGKPDKIIQYNHAGEKEEETLFEYAHTKAHENGYERNQMSRDNMLRNTDFELLTNWVHARDYEYGDYYRNEADVATGMIGYGIVLKDTTTDHSYLVGDTLVTELTVTLAYTDLDTNIISTAIPGFEAVIPPFKLDYMPIYAAVDTLLGKSIVAQAGYLGTHWGDMLEKPAFLETSMYYDLKDQNPEFFFHSYFIKTARQKSRSYDDYTGVVNEGGSGIAIGAGETINNNPFGPSYDNPIATAAVDAQLISKINTSTDGTDIEGILIANSPLSEAVLTHLTTRVGTFNHDMIRAVFTAQSALSDAVLKEIYTRSNQVPLAPATAIFTDQPYLSDAFLKDIAATAGQYSDALIQNIYGHNAYLSDTVMLTMSEATSFSANVLSVILADQGQLSESVLVSVANPANQNAGFAVENILTGQPILTDSVYKTVAGNTSLPNNHVMNIYNYAVGANGISNTGPGDNALIALIKRNPQPKMQDMVVLLKGIDHYFGDSLRTVINDNVPLADADEIFEYQDRLNPYGAFCSKTPVEGRDYLETVTEYTYYEANYDGTTLAEGYKKLMGLEDVEGKVVTAAESGLPTDLTLSAINLKHLPSWQVFSTKTYSTDYANAYERKEYYYYFDLLNRISRHIEYYDVASGDYDFIVDSSLSPYPLIFSSHWPVDYSHGSGLNEGHFPLPDGAKNAKRNKLHGLAFQATTFTANNDGNSPIMRSEYYNYDSRWNRPDDMATTTVTYAGPNCGEATVDDCADCFFLKWLGSEADIMDQVPWNYCAYRADGGVRVCPTGIDPSGCGYVVTDFIGCAPTSAEPVTEPDSVDVLAPLIQDPLGKGLYLRSVVAQLDSIPTTDSAWYAHRMDGSNDYIMDFYMGGPSDWDSLSRRRSYAVYPFDTLTFRTIDQRNRYTQVQLEHNTMGIYTRYAYNEPERIWHQNTNATAACPGLGNYSSYIHRNTGLPTEITVGVGRIDSLTTTYTYYPNHAIDSLVDANGHTLHYTYDDYDRLEKSYENGRLLSSNNYHYWNRDTSLTFAQRTSQNYVETQLYNSAVLTTGEHLRAYIDPLGRNYSTITTIQQDSLQVHSGTVRYDNWGRVARAYKPYRLADQLTLQPQSDTSLAYTHSLYENTPKSRMLRGAKYGITNILDTHMVKQNYRLVDEVMLTCELNLNAPEVALIIDPDFGDGHTFTRVETFDEDHKKTVSFTNGIGQQVATLQYGNSTTDKIITLFGYDDYGNLTTVINPEKQYTHYTYNILGQLIKEETVDGGITKFMYNKQGLVALEQDANGRKGVPNPSGGTDTVAYYRTYTYDDYGRLLSQKRVFWQDPASLPVTNNNAIDPLFYRDSVDGTNPSTGLPVLTSGAQTYFDYSFSNRSTYDWLAEIKAVDFEGGGASGGPVVKTYKTVDFINLYGGVQEKTFVYGTDTTTNSRGKLYQSTSFNADGTPVERITYAYNNENHVANELVEFSKTGAFTDPAQRVITRITYPTYNYRGALETMQVDVGDDGTLDFQYTYTYDNWNRLNTIYASFKAGEIGNRVVSYTYDDALGLLTQTKHYTINANDTCGEQVAQTITHSYDVRDRLTSITSELFDYYLYYDDQTPTHADFATPVSFDQNWNGNINGTVADYRIDHGGVSNSSSVNTTFSKATVYGYTYDQINRLVGADANAGDRVTSVAASQAIGDVTYHYDKIGNITHLQRGIGTIATATEWEEWNYHYQNGTNRLGKVEGLGTTTTRNYTYDANGNLMTDDHRSLTDIDYARKNYPFHLSKTDAEIDYLYSIDDQRIYKETQRVSDTTKAYYLKNIGYLNINTNTWEWYVNGADRVAKITPTATQQPATISAADPTLNDALEVSFYLYDHLGNTRVVYQPSIQCPAFMQYELEYLGDYYPYGKSLREFIIDVSDPEKFLTTQHERDQETGFDYRGARFYDSDVARFLSLDPLAADYPSLSDYSYVAGNPIIFIDPDGKAVTSPNPMMYMAHEMKKYFGAIFGFFSFDWFGKGRVKVTDNEEKVNTYITVETYRYTSASGKFVIDMSDAILGESTDLKDYVDIDFSIFVGNSVDVIYGPENQVFEVKESSVVETDQNGNTKAKTTVQGKISSGAISVSGKVVKDSNGKVTTSENVSLGSGSTKVTATHKSSSDGSQSVEVGAQVGGKVKFLGIEISGSTGVSVKTTIK